MQMDALVSIKLSHLADRDYPSEQNKKEYFHFLREVAAVYDEYAEALLSCRKQGQCHVSPIQNSCSSFSKRVDSLSKLDRLETKDIPDCPVDASSFQPAIPVLSPVPPPFTATLGHEAMPRPATS
jgi:hypothetical protein